ncbi:MAG: Mut7-C RNAse domain-containing protein [Desulfurococcales archaeon]|nr:Mut7-C RNAse domain-containing protein [Desulfurococcales archaeon]
MAKGKRFIADAMMGEVARWLRLLGYDTLYSRNYSDYQILRIAESTRRIIVTSDRGLHSRARRRGLRSIYISSHKIEERLAQVALGAGIRLHADPDRSRCPECNGELVKIKDKSLVKDKVPPGALNSYDTFYICRRCGRVYWRGGHWRNIERVLEEASRLVTTVRGMREGRDKR